MCAESWKSMKKCSNCHFCSTNDIFWCTVQFFWLAGEIFLSTHYKTLFFAPSLPSFGVSFCHLLAGFLPSYVQKSVAFFYGGVKAFLSTACCCQKTGIIKNTSLIKSCEATKQFMLRLQI